MCMPATLPTQQLRHLEREVERLPGVEARVALGLVALLEMVAEDLVAAAEALGDVLAGELDVHAAGPDVVGVARGEEAMELAHHVDEVTRLVAARVLEGVAVHRVADPHHRLSRELD